MSYIKHTWVQRVGTLLNRFKKTNETIDYVELTNEPTAITTDGTPLSSTWLNEMEDGIYNNSNDLDIIKDGGTLQGLSHNSDVDFKTISIKGTKLILTPTNIIKFSFNAPAGIISGLAFDGTNLISCDNNTNKIYIHDGITSTILSSFDAPATSIQGLTFDGTNLISGDNVIDKIYIHDGITSTILSSFDAPATSIRGLTFDGTNLISTNGFDVFIHDGITSTILSSFDSSLNDIRGLAFDGTNLISCDIITDKIYIHDGITSTILSSFDAPATATFGLTFTGANLISGDNVIDKIYIHTSNITI